MKAPWSLFILLSISVVCVMQSEAQGEVCKEEIKYENCTCTENSNSQTHQIKCEYCTFNVIPPDLPNLNQFKIQNCHIPVIEELPYNKLRTVILQNNRIRFIKDHAFSKLTQVHELILRNNDISGLSNFTFAGLNSLTVLNLVNNSLYEIPDYTFNGAVNLPNMEILKLSSCKLFHISPLAFFKTTNLKWLYLDNNYLKTVDSFINSTHIQGVETLDLSYNELRQLPTFGSMALQELVLSNNILRNLTAGTFVNLHYLKRLFLARNEIIHISSGTFHPMLNLTEIDLTYNSLMFLEEMALPWGNLERLLIYENPWSCECSNQWLVNHRAVFVANYNYSLRCYAPVRLEGQYVFQVKEELACVDHVSIMTQFGIAIGIIAAIVIFCSAVLILYKSGWKKKFRYKSNMAADDVFNTYTKVDEPEL